MNETALTFMKDLLSKPTPSGYEQPGQKVISEYMGRYADSVHTDVNGNVHGVLNPDAPFRVMLAGHCKGNFLARGERILLQKKGGTTWL